MLLVIYHTNADVQLLHHITLKVSIFGLSRGSSFMVSNRGHHLLVGKVINCFFSNSFINVFYFNDRNVIVLKVGIVVERLVHFLNGSTSADD